MQKKSNSIIEDTENITIKDITLAAELETVKPSSASEAKYLNEAFTLFLNKHGDLIYHSVRKILTVSLVPVLLAIVIIWLLLMLLFVACAGFGWWGFRLPDNVFIALITSTTASVIGLFHYVGRWLYAAAANESNNKED